MFFKKTKEEKKFKKPVLGKESIFELKQFEFKKTSDPGRKLSITVYDNEIKGKSYSGETLKEFAFKSTEIGLLYSNVSDEVLLALVPALSKYEGSFFGQKTILDFDGKKEEKYPVFFSTYKSDYFKGKETKSHVTGFAYVSRDAVENNKMISVQEVK